MKLRKTKDTGEGRKLMDHDREEEAAIAAQWDRKRSKTKDTMVKTQSGWILTVPWRRLRTAGVYVGVTVWSTRYIGKISEATAKRKLEEMRAWVDKYVARLNQGDREQTEKQQSPKKAAKKKAAKR